MKNLIVVLAIAALSPLAVAQPALVPPIKPIAPPITLAEAEKLVGGPTLVTLHLKNATVEQFSAALEPQIGLKVTWGEEDTEQKKRRVTLDLEKVPFWTALSEISKALAVDYGVSTPGQLTFTPGGGSEHRGLVLQNTSAARFVLRTAQRTQTLDFTGEDTPENKRGLAETNLNLQLLLMLEPRLAALPNIAHSTGVVATFKGKDMPIERHEVAIDRLGEQVWFVVVPLHEPADAGAKSASLRGAVRFYLPLRHEHWEIPDVLKAKGATKTVRGPQGNETYTLKDIRKVSDVEYAVEFAVKSPPLGTTPQGDANQDIQEINRDLNEARFQLTDRINLFDSEGKPYAVVGYSSEEGIRTYNFCLREEDVPAGVPDPAHVPIGDLRPQSKGRFPVKLVLDIPTEIRTVEVPFQFKEIPLP